MEQEILGLFGKTFGAYLYGFLIIYGVHRCHIIILEQYLRWHYQLFDFVVVHTKGTVIAGANASRWIQVPL
jgi:cell division protein FtsW